jgi:methionyl-tRNA formyltransferase
MIAKDDGRIAWARSALELDAQIRAFTPWPLSYTSHRGQSLYILEARPYVGSVSFPAAPVGTVLGVDKAAGILVQTGEGLLAVTRLQYGTKKALDWRSFLNGARDFSGSRLGVD